MNKCLWNSIQLLSIISPGKKIEEKYILAAFGGGGWKISDIQPLFSGEKNTKFFYQSRRVMGCSGFLAQFLVHVIFLFTFLNIFFHAVHNAV